MHFPRVPGAHAFSGIRAVTGARAGDMAASGGAKSGKLDEAQALARSCAGRPDFLPCDGLSICATHSHGKCFKLHWCCHLGWCHCKFLHPSNTVSPETSPLVAHRRALGRVDTSSKPHRQTNGSEHMTSANKVSREKNPIIAHSENKGSTRNQGVPYSHSFFSNLCHEVMILETLFKPVAIQRTSTRFLRNHL